MCQLTRSESLDQKIVDCVFLSYAIHSVGYRFLVINSGVPDMIVGTIMESRDVTFFESEFLMKNTPSTSSHESIFLPRTHEPVIHADVETHEDISKEDNNIVTRKGKRQRVVKSFGEDYIIYLVDDTPTTIAEAYSSLNADLWKEAK